MAGVNYLAILVSGIAAMIVGYLWYSPFLFGNMWMKLTGRKMSEMAKEKDQMPKLYGLLFVATLVMGFVFDQMLTYNGITQMQPTSVRIVAGAAYAFFLWLGFIAPTIYTDYLFKEKKSLALLLLDNGHRLAAIIAMAIVLVMMG